LAEAGRERLGCEIDRPGAAACQRRRQAVLQSILVQKEAVFGVVFAIGPREGGEVGGFDDPRQFHRQEFLDVEAGHAIQRGQFADPGVIGHVDGGDPLLQRHHRSMHAEPHHEVAARREIRRPVIHVEMG
jgi:hypothetical protein